MAAARSVRAAIEAFGTWWSAGSARNHVGLRRIWQAGECPAALARAREGVIHRPLRPGESVWICMRKRGEPVWSSSPMTPAQLVSCIDFHPHRALSRDEALSISAHAATKATRSRASEDGSGLHKSEAGWVTPTKKFTLCGRRSRRWRNSGQVGGRQEDDLRRLMPCARDRRTQADVIRTSEGRGQATERTRSFRI